MSKHVRNVGDIFPSINGKAPLLVQDVNYTEHTIHLASSSSRASEVVDALSVLKPKYVIDATACIGGHTLALGLSNKFSHVLAYERDPHTIQMLRNNLQLYNLTEKVTSFHQEFKDSEDICVCTGDKDAKRQTAVLIDPEWIGDYSKTDYSEADFLLENIQFSGELLDDVIARLKKTYRCVLVHVPKKYIFRDKDYYVLKKRNRYHKHKIAVFGSKFFDSLYEKTDIYLNDVRRDLVDVRRDLVEARQNKPTIAKTPSLEFQVYQTLDAIPSMLDTTLEVERPLDAMRGLFLAEWSVLASHPNARVVLAKSHPYDALLKKSFPCTTFLYPEDPYVFLLEEVLLFNRGVSYGQTVQLAFKYKPDLYILHGYYEGTHHLLPYSPKDASILTISSTLAPATMTEEDGKKMQWFHNVAQANGHDLLHEASLVPRSISDAYAPIEFPSYIVSREEMERCVPKPVVYPKNHPPISNAKQQMLAKKCFATHTTMGVSDLPSSNVLNSLSTLIQDPSLARFYMDLVVLTSYYAIPVNVHHVHSTKLVNALVQCFPNAVFYVYEPVEEIVPIPGRLYVMSESFLSTEITTESTIFSFGKLEKGMWQKHNNVQPLCTIAPFYYKNAHPDADMYYVPFSNMPRMVVSGKIALVRSSPEIEEMVLLHNTLERNTGMWDEQTFQSAIDQYNAVSGSQFSFSLPSRPSNDALKAALMVEYCGNPQCSLCKVRIF